MLRPEGERIGLERLQGAVGTADLELVVLTGGEARHEQLPDAAVAPQAHRVTAPVPIVEVADHADPAGIRRPDREAVAVDAVEGAGMGPEHAVDEVAADLAQAVDLVLLQRGTEAVGIVAARRRAVPGLDLDLVERAALALHAGDVESVGMHALERQALAAGEQPGALGLGQDRADLPGAGTDLMRSEHAEGVAVIGGHHRGDGLGGQVRVAGLGDGATGARCAALSGRRFRRPGG